MRKPRAWIINLSLHALYGLVSIATLYGLLEVWAPSRPAWSPLDVARLPPLVGVAFTVVALDLLYYLLHWIGHKWSLLWRVHRVHHSALDFDLSLFGRFNFIGAVVNASCVAAFMVLCNVSLFEYVVFLTIVGASGIFIHTNLRLPQRFDALLRLVLCTPDMHRIHHSVNPVENGANYGTVFSCWDRLFGTYRRGAEAEIEIGMAEYRDPEDLTFWKLMGMPFRG
jgi:sterol desaturase/sphingolipid hydroxylase (fatty acid hydroxylase superfamily)